MFWWPMMLMIYFKCARWWLTGGYDCRNDEEKPDGRNDTFA